jgi:hypothetical protein
MKQRRKAWGAWTVALSVALLAAAPTAEAVCVSGARDPAGPCGGGGDLCCGTLSPGTQTLDSDGDDYGNFCDGDFNQDCVVSGADLITVLMTFGAPACIGEMKFDLDEDAVPCGFPDYLRFHLLWGQAPDP